MVEAVIALLEGRGALFGGAVVLLVCVVSALWWRVSKAEQALADHEAHCDTRTARIHQRFDDTAELLGEIRADVGYLRGRADVHDKD